MDLKEKPERIVKIVFVGNPSAGKTSLLNRVADDTFTQNYMCTIGVDFKIRRYDIDGETVKAQFWDTAGQERFRCMSKAYYRGADAVIICYNLNDQDSFNSLSFWLQELHTQKIDELSTVLVGCKKDLDIQVPTDAVIEFLRDKPYLHFETSAKTGQGVKEATDAIVRMCAERKRRLEMVNVEKEDLNKGLQKAVELPKIKSCSC